MTPHKCPVCDGTGKVETLSPGYTTAQISTCPACKGICIVWESEFVTQIITTTEEKKGD